MRWLGLFALFVTIVYGLFYDYLYNGNWNRVAFLSAWDGDDRNSKPEPVPEMKLSNSPRIIPIEHGNDNWFTFWLSFQVLALNINKIIPLWYANLGAVQMSQAELKDFPANQWATSDMVHSL